ncbi:MAG: SH3 domain-containing protein [Gammaproteobacteria bacterium]|nr:SH3 domain-containing protein [Gammaproteobacteria bacterium]MBU1724227.1 SH3 domain-containing protein [Gammaproteobacteria bacterium]MBU2007175.1 SH3 domain-containing protein [Gammaproteobacteria bacterium]
MKIHYAGLLLGLWMGVVSAADYAVVNITPDDVLNVRQGAGINFPKVGKLQGGSLGVRSTGADKQVFVPDGYTFWRPVRHAKLSGWVRADYLAPQSGKDIDAVGQAANRAFYALKDCRAEALAKLAHPAKGVRFGVTLNEFTPSDVTLSAQDIRAAFRSQRIYRWGTMHGETVEMSLSALCDTVLQPPGIVQSVQVGEVLSSHGLNNAHMVNYHDADTVEGGKAGFKVLVEQYQGNWYLVGLVPWSEI